MTFWIIAGVGVVFVLFVIGLMRAASLEAPKQPIKKRLDYTFVVCPNMQAFDYWCRQHQLNPRDRHVIAMTPTRVKQGYTRGYQYQDGDNVEYEAEHLMKDADWVQVQFELRVIGFPLDKLC